MTNKKWYRVANTDRTCGIYRLYFENSDCSYIGSSVDIESRYEEHLEALNKRKHHSKKLQEYFNETKQVPLYKILALTEECYLEIVEKSFITSFDSFKKGFNASINTRRSTSGSTLLKAGTVALEKLKRLQPSLIKHCSFNGFGANLDRWQQLKKLTELAEQYYRLVKVLHKNSNVVEIRKVIPADKDLIKWNRKGTIKKAGEYDENFTIDKALKTALEVCSKDYQPVQIETNLEDS